MSFSLSVKQEILENKTFRYRYQKAQAYGLVRFAKCFSSQRVQLVTESEGVAKRFAWHLHSLLGREASVVLEEAPRAGGLVYTVKLTRKQDRLCLLEQLPTVPEFASLLPTPGHVSAFLSGVFLACGNMADPEKSYHLEFVVREEPLALALSALLEAHIPGVKRTTRRKLCIAYYKECTQIEDLLTMMGASKACLAVIDVEMIKSVRNQVNRVTNCETANIDKQVNAAAQQLEDIRLLLDTLGEDALPAHLRDVALLRLQNPELSLRELVQVFPESISRSGMHHRLDRLSRMAAEIREGKRNV